MANERHRTRRDFLKIGSAGLVGALGGGCADGDPPPSTPSPDKKKRRIVSRRLGRTGLDLPVVSMGSCYAINLVSAALDEGVVYLHTSSGYAGQNHEKLIGEAVRGRQRESFAVGTSPDLPYRYRRGSGRSRDLGIEADPALIVRSAEQSLGFLGLDYIDIYFLASVNTRESVLHEPYLAVYRKLKEEGKIRFAGVATHASEPEVIRAAIEGGVWDVVLTAFNFRQSHREEVRAAIHQAAGAGLGIMAMKTQAGVYWDRLSRRKINMKAALKWVLQDEHVHTTVPAFANFEEMEESLSVMEDLAMTPQEVEDIGSGDVPETAGLFCQQCGSCLDQCPAGLEIPTLMRSYMYCFGHGQPGKARATLRGWRSADIACRSCESCPVRCSLGFAVSSRAREMARLLDVPGEFLA